MSSIKETDQSTKRLFIGGFCGNIKENELRDRFESFGQVSSVEIVNRRDEQGNPIKTFAYVDLGTSDAQLKKCISLLNNTKWKGNQMKVQLAKEDFLTRLKRERKEKTIGENSNCEKVQSEDISHKLLVSDQKGIPLVLAGAVPGTPVPGKRNWVVSKFSRVLPVVYLRRRDNRKVAKFDPSKTAHNIKRFKCEDDEVSYTQLTWSLENKNGTKSHSLNQTKGERCKANCKSKCDKSIPMVSGLFMADTLVDPTVTNSTITSKTRIDRLTETRRDKNKCLDGKESEEKLEIKKRKLLETDDTSTVERPPEFIFVKGHSKDQNLQRNGKKARNFVTTKYSVSETSSVTSSDVCNLNFKEVDQVEQLSGICRTCDSSSTTDDSYSHATSGESDLESELPVKQNEMLTKELEKNRERNGAGECSDFVGSTIDNSVDSSEEESAVESTRDNSVDSSEEECAVDSTIDNSADSSEEESDVNSTIDNSVDSSEEESAVDSTRDNSVDSSEEECAVDLTRDNSVDSSEEESAVDSTRDNSVDSSEEESAVDSTCDNSVDSSKEKCAVDSTIDNSVDSSEEESDVNSTIDNSIDSSEDGSAVENGSTSRWTNNEKTVETNEKKELNFDESGHQSQKDKNNNENNKEKSRSSACNQTGKSLASEDATGFAGSTGRRQLDSNERRLDALKERQKFANSKKSLVHLALQNLDSNSSRQNVKRGHIVFDEDPHGRQVNEGSREESTNNSEARFPSNKKISGSQAASWLGFDSGESEEEHGSEGGNDEMFSLKPQFEGKAGERLFRLQKSFGRDQRFQMDKRFLESDDESDDEQVESSVKDTEERAEEGDAVSKQLAEERSRLLAVLQKVLGRNVGLNINARTTEEQKTTSDFGSLHYDPTREDHKQFEEKPTKNMGVLDPEPAKTIEPVLEDEASQPQVTKDRFYDVNTSSLADMFGGKGEVADKQQKPFTFLLQEETADSCEPSIESQQEAQMETLGPRPWASQMLPYDSSDDEDRADDSSNDAVMASDENRQEIVPKTELFFFHAEDPKLANRLNDESATVFMRTESVEELTKYWETVRSQLTRDYKRKHKDATRRQNKIAAKRNKSWTS